jgi:hypothetical protein
MELTVMQHVISAGDFDGDITDDVSSLDAESCLGLVGWLDFYHKVRCFENHLTVLLHH